MGEEPGGARAMGARAFGLDDKQRLLSQAHSVRCYAKSLGAQHCSGDSGFISNREGKAKLSYVVIRAPSRACQNGELAVQSHELRFRDSESIYDTTMIAYARIAWSATASAPSVSDNG